MAANDYDWNEARIAQLRELWADEKLTAAAVGAIMGCSKNSVVGKVLRLKLPPRPSPIKRFVDGAPPKPAVIRRVTGPTLPPLPPLPALEDVPCTVSNAIPYQAPPDPESRLACCWPLGTPGTAAFRFCGEHAMPGRPYCPEHRDIATTAHADLKRQPAEVDLVQAYAAKYAVVVRPGVGVAGLLVAVNNHRRMVGLTPYSLRNAAA